MISQEKIVIFIQCRDAYTKAVASNNNNLIVVEIQMVNAYREMVKGTAQEKCINRLIKRGIWKSSQAPEFVKMIANYNVPA